MGVGVGVGLGRWCASSTEGAKPSVDEVRMQGLVGLGLEVWECAVVVVVVVGIRL